MAIAIDEDHLKLTALSLTPSDGGLYQTVKGTPHGGDRSRSCTSMTSQSVQTGGPPRRVLSVLSMVGLCYFAVCGGPIGSENIVAVGGPLVGWLGMCFIAVVWSIPISFIAAELSTLYPEDGGYTIWVLHAFGPFWGFQTGYWSWLSGVIDNALYPSLALTTIKTLVGDFSSPVVEYLIKAGVTILWSLPNFFGIKLVGNSMMFLSVFVMAPFVATDWSAFGEVRRTNVVELDDGTVQLSGSVDIQWSLLINTLFWNFSGCVQVSVFGGEVKDPARTYPKAMVLSVLFIVLTYCIPFFGAVAYNHPHWSSWQENSYLDIAKEIGGHGFYLWVVIVSFGSNTGMFIAELFCDSFQLYGMARCGLAPACFKARNQRYDTPHNTILCSVVIMLILIIFSFDQIVNMTNGLAGMYNLLIIGAFLKLRISKGDLVRPYKVPGNSVVIALVALLPATVLIYITVDIFTKWLTAVLGVVAIGAGFAYAAVKKFKVDLFMQLRMEE